MVPRFFPNRPNRCRLSLCVMDPSSAAGDGQPAAKRPRGKSSEGNEAPDEYHPRSVGVGFRLLVVGDGDLSWSLATARTLPQGAHMVCTTFDTAEELAKRYPGDRLGPTLRELGALAAAAAAAPSGDGPSEEQPASVIEVRHGVDATKLQRSDFFGGEPCDRIVFNFPHHGGQVRASARTSTARGNTTSHCALLWRLLAGPHRAKPQAPLQLFCCRLAAPRP